MVRQTFFARFQRAQFQLILDPDVSRLATFSRRCRGNNK
jgi:hypothetical protein